MARSLIEGVLRNASIVSRGGFKVDFLKEIFQQFVKAPADRARPDIQGRPFFTFYARAAGMTHVLHVQSQAWIAGEQQMVARLIDDSSYINGLKDRKDLNWEYLKETIR